MLNSNNNNNTNIKSNKLDYNQINTKYKLLRPNSKIKCVNNI